MHHKPPIHGNMSSDSDEEQLYKDLKGFLQADRADLRKAATEAVLQVRDLRGMEKLVQHGLVELLAKNASFSDDQVSINALKALVHLSSHGTSANQCIEDLIESGGLNRMIEIVLSSATDGPQDAWRQKVNHALSLLSNMTRTEKGAVEFVGRTLPDEAVSATDLATEELPTKPSMELILARFLNAQYLEDDFNYDELVGDEALDGNTADPYQHFAAVLMNSTQVEAGRRFVVKIHRKDGNDQGTALLQTLLPQLRSPNPLRRRGIAGMIRNCCLDTDSSWWMLNVVNITKHILYPLAGPEELDVEEKQGLDPDLWLEGPDKKREPDHWTRLFLVESILLLCASGRKSREKLRLEKVYTVLKWADMVEEHEDVSERVYECVNFLRRDEEGTEEGSSDRLVADTYKKPSAARTVGLDEDFDDVD